MKGCFKFIGYGILGFIVLVIVLIVALPKTSKQSKTVQPTQTTATSTPILRPTDDTPKPPPAYLALYKCTQRKIDGIATGLTVGGGGTLDASTAQAVQSNDYKKVFFIAAAIHGQGFGDKGQIALWASNSLQVSDGLIFPVDAMAKEFSDWGKGDERLSQFDDGGQEAIKCVEYKQNRRITTT